MNQREAPGFLYKVYQMLENEVDIICWNEDGDEFYVKNIQDFQQRVLPHYFKHQNFASFVRQVYIKQLYLLNQYDFTKTEKYSFKHQLFKKHQKDLLPQIKRKINNHQIYLSIESMSKEVNMLLIRNSELEQLVKFIMKQSERLRKENEFLWGEIIRSKQQNSNEDLLEWIIDTGLNCQSLSASSILKILETSLSKKDLIKLASKYQEASNKKCKTF